MQILTYEYKGFWDCPSRCNVHYGVINGISFICFEEIENNPGTSVTNMSEHLATQIVEMFKLTPGKCKFFETYPENKHREERSFDEILYTWDGNKASHPHWLPSKDRDIFGF